MANADDVINVCDDATVHGECYDATADAGDVTMTNDDDDRDGVRYKVYVYR